MISFMDLFENVNHMINTIKQKLNDFCTGTYWLKLDFKINVKSISLLVFGIL